MEMRGSHIVLRVRVPGTTHSWNGELTSRREEAEIKHGSGVSCPHRGSSLLLITALLGVAGFLSPQPGGLNLESSSTRPRYRNTFTFQPQNFYGKCRDLNGPMVRKKSSFLLRYLNLRQKRMRSKPKIQNSDTNHGPKVNH